MEVCTRIDQSGWCAKGLELVLVVPVRMFGWKELLCKV
jgi:hypothetical protein